MKVYCEDGWIVFLRRTHDTNFYQDWQGYAKGFGEIDDGLIISKILLKQIFGLDYKTYTN